MTVGGMVGLVVGWRFCKLSTGWGVAHWGVRWTTCWGTMHRANVQHDCLFSVLTGIIFIKNKNWAPVCLFVAFVHNVRDNTPKFLGFCIRNIPLAAFLHVFDVYILGLHYGSNLAPWIGGFTWIARHCQGFKDAESKIKRGKKRVLPT